MSKLDIMYHHNSDEWETPQDLYDELDREFHFTLDPCCSEENRKCTKYFTKAENGLMQSWGGRQYFVIRHTRRPRNGLKRQQERTPQQ